MTPESSWADRFYSHFLARDFVYIFAGGFLVCIVESALFDEFFLPKQFSLELLGFLSISYFIGFVIYNFGNLVFPFLKVPIPEIYKSYLVFYQDLVKNYDIKVLNNLERIYYKRSIGMTVGSASFFGGIFMAIVTFSRWFIRANPPLQNYILSFCLIFVGFFMIFDAKKTCMDIKLHHEELIKNFRKIE